MKSTKYNILAISGYPPERSAGLVMDYMTAMEEDGHSVDFFTMYSFSNQKKNHYNIYPRPFSDRLLWIKQKLPFLSVFNSIAKNLFPKPEDKLPTIINKGFIIHNFDESNPPLPNYILREKLPNKQYDFVMVFIMQRMLTTSSFQVIYDKYKVPILMLAVDMLHLTGGCYFFGSCIRFGKGCGCCPVLDSNDNNDQTRKNFLYKKDIYEKIPHTLICNEHQKKFALQSGLFHQDNLYTSTILIDEEKFFPQNVSVCRKHFGIPQEKEFIILARYEGQCYSRMKGYDHLLNIINNFSNKLCGEQKKKCLLLLVGIKDDIFEAQFDIDLLNIGHLSKKDLISCYSASSVFISTSIDDAGPSMVNQSMMCGTPVISFSIGTALQVTIEGESGYMIPNYDDDKFAQSLLNLSCMDDEQYRNLRKRTREIAIGLTSKKVIAKDIIKAYESILRKCKKM